MESDIPVGIRSPMNRDLFRNVDFDSSEEVGLDALDAQLAACLAYWRGLGAGGRLPLSNDGARVDNVLSASVWDNIKMPGCPSVFPDPRNNAKMLALFDSQAIYDRTRGKVGCRYTTNTMRI